VGRGISLGTDSSFLETDSLANVTFHRRPRSYFRVPDLAENPAFVAITVD
jgi:hypothetical protein